MSFNIAIDGPAGAGKSTIAKAAARALGFIYVDTGAMYRALALYVLTHPIDAGDEAAVARAMPGIDVTIAYADGAQQVLLNGENVTDRIRDEQVGNMASKISAYGPVREKLLGLQRSLAARNDVIMDGRDIGTHVLPEAPLKIYLTASVEARAQRRYKELTEKGVTASLEAVAQDIKARDHNDMTRTIAPLRQAEDAVYVDTSDMDIPQVIERIIELYHDRVPGCPSGPQNGGVDGCR